MEILNAEGKWELPYYPLIPDKSIVLDWVKFFPIEIRDQPNAIHLRSEFISYFSILADPDLSGRKYVPTTLHREFEDHRTIARWMAISEIWRLGDLRISHIIDFLRSRMPRIGGVRPAQRTIERWIYRFQRMWDLRNYYEGALNVDVGCFEDEIYLQVRGRLVEKWKALPDHVAFALITDGLDWIKRFGDFQINYLVAYIKYRDETALMPRYHQNKASKQFFEKLRSDDRFNSLAASLDYNGGTGNLMMRAMAMLEGACLCVLLLVVGMRASEVIALNRDALVLSDSANGYQYLSGPAAKKGGMFRLWVLGNQLIHVIKLLTQLGDVMRNGGSSALFLNRQGPASIYRPGKKAVRMTRDQMVMRINDFATSRLRKNAVQADKFHPHMARKTFAQLAVRRDRSLLEPVSAHLGHVYQSFTDGHYVGSDHSLAKLLSEADRRELAASLEHLLSCGTVVGGGAAGLEDVRRDLKFKGKRALTSIVNGLIKKGIKIAPCDWGFCMYSEAYSACDGDAVGPNEVKRAPDVCAGCKNFVVTERHRHWWEDRVKREEKFLLQKGLPEQTIALVSRRLARSENVLKNVVWLNAPTAEIQVD